MIDPEYDAILTRAAEYHTRERVANNMVTNGFDGPKLRAAQDHYYKLYHDEWNKLAALNAADKAKS